MMKTSNESQKTGIRRKLFMYETIFIVLLECMISFILVQCGVLEKNNEVYSCLLICINTIIFLAYLSTQFKQKEYVIYLIILVSYAIRLILIFYDTYVEPLALSDIEEYRRGAEAFFYTGKALYNGGQSNTVLFMGLFYKVFGVQRILLEYFVTIIMVFEGVWIYRFLSTFKVEMKLCALAVAWVQFSPMLIRNTCVVNRESFINICVFFSLVAFTKWYKSGKFLCAVESVAWVMAGCFFHAGIIGVAIGYIMAFILYSHQKHAFVFTWQSIAACALVALMIALLYMGAFDIFMKKFTNLTLTKMLTNVEKAEGGAYYNIGGDITTLWQMLLYTPIRALYFWCSPMPWDWRGLQDMAAFMCSSALYAYTFYIAVKGIRARKDSIQNLIAIYLLCLIVCGVIFGWGVKNAGTAMRHRDKFISIAAITLVLSMSNKRTEEAKQKINYDGHREIKDDKKS